MNIKDLQLKRVLRGILLVLLLYSAGMGKMYAQNFTEGNLRYSINDDGTTVTVRGLAQGVSASGSLVIPGSVTYNGISYSVTVIGDYAFQRCSGFTGSLTIGNSVETIGAKAFESCTGFTGSLTIPNSVTTIGSSAFAICWGFTGSLIIGNSVTEIGGDAFNGCSEIVSLTLGNSVSIIGGAAFCGCSRLSSVTFPNSNSLTVIGGLAFLYDHELYSISIPNSVTVIGSDAFKNTGWYDNQPNGILYLDGWCLGYKGEKPTGDLEIPMGTKGIAGLAFEYCTEITSIVFPPSMLYIGECFSYYDDESELTSVTIPSSVISIASESFAYCTNLTSVYYTGNIAQWCGISFGGEDGTCPFPYGYNLYMGNELLTSLDTSETISTIGPNSFANCGSLTGDLVIPNTVASIGQQAFMACENLTSVTIPSSVTAIGEGAFSFCCGITFVTIPNSVTTIGDGAFSACDEFSVYYEGDIVQWCAIAFEGAVVAYYDNGYSLYIGNELVTQLVIPEALTSIGQYTFSSCVSITSVTIPNSVTSIGEKAFFYCSSLTSVTIPNPVTLVGDRAFMGCSGLTSIIIGNSVSSIGEYAFEGSNPTTITMLGTTPPTLEGEWGPGFSSSNPGFTIFVPKASLNTYKTANNWSYYEQYIKPMFAPSIIGYASSTSNDKWNLIAVPLAEDIDPAAVLNMLSEDHDYDLYQYDQSIEGGEWRNYKVDSFNLVNGRGYLYATAVDLNLIIGGEFNEDETKVVNLDYDAGKANAGWNLVGNPFPCNAYINRDYYVMNEDGTGINPVAVSASTPIPPCTGVFVKAEGEGETVIFTRAEP